MNEEQKNLEFYILDIEFIENLFKYWIKPLKIENRGSYSCLKKNFEICSNFGLVSKSFHQVQKNYKEFEFECFEGNIKLNSQLFIKLCYVWQQAQDEAQYNIHTEQAANYAIEHGFYDLLEPLLTLFPKLFKNIRKEALSTACQFGYLRTVKKLFSLHPNIGVNFFPRYGETAITSAAKSGNIKLVKYLIKNNASLKEIKPHFSSNLFPHLKRQILEYPLFAAIELVNYEIIELLIYHKVDLKLLNEQSQTALQFAKEKGDKKIINLIQEYNDLIEKEEQ